MGKSFGRVRAVAAIDLDVCPKEIYGLLGPNGSGKSTTLSMLAGVLRPGSGDIRLDGVAVSHSAARARLGYVPQEVALYPQMTAAENLSFFGRMQGVRGKTLRRRVRAALDVVDLAAHADRRVERFSAGMKRRANIAAALVHAPDVLIMDEPTVGVDPQSRNAILSQVAELAAGGSAVVFASHYMEEVQRLCGRVGIIDAGRILVEGPIQDVLARSAARSRIALTGQAESDETLRSMLGRVLPDGLSVRKAGHEFHVQTGTPGATLAQLLRAADDAGVALGDVRLIKPTLEDVFLELTGKALRE
jgi:ABC-2 type transport system ATP-binding protein